MIQSQLFLIHFHIAQFSIWKNQAINLADLHLMGTFFLSPFISSICQSFELGIRSVSIQYSELQ
jgi:hypothetical protein